MDPIRKWNRRFCSRREQNKGVTGLWRLTQGLAGQIRLAQLAGLGEGSRIVAAVMVHVALHCRIVS